MFENCFIKKCTKEDKCSYKWNSIRGNLVYKELAYWREDSN
jgi:hypothetical protein